jgi:hypothetical protein
MGSRNLGSRDLATQGVNRNATVNRSSRVHRDGRRHASNRHHRHHRHHRHFVGGGWWFPGYYDDYDSCYQYAWTESGYRYVNVCGPDYYGYY